MINVPLIYGCDDQQIAKNTEYWMNEDSCMYIGGGIEDHLAFQIADVAVQVNEGKGKSLLPADISLTNLNQLLPLMKMGRWMLDLFNEMIRMSIVFTLFAVLGGIFLDRTKRNFVIYYQLDWSLFSTFVFIILPTVVRLIFMKYNSKEYIKKSVFFT